MELGINSLANKNIGYFPFFLNSGYHPIIPTKLLCGNEIASNEKVGQFCKRMKLMWDAMYENMKNFTTLQANYYNERYKMIVLKVSFNFIEHRECEITRI